MTRRPPRSPLFPSPPLSRSAPTWVVQSSARPPRGLPAPLRPVRISCAAARACPRETSRSQGAFTTAASPRCSKRRSEEHTSELQSRLHLVCRLLLEKKTLYYDTLTVNPCNGRFLHCIQMDTSVNAASKVFSVGADIAFDADPTSFSFSVRFESSSFP